MRPGPSDGVPLKVSIDFVLEPASAADERRIAVFLDGWQHHADRIGRDLVQGMTLLATGWDVWTFTWL